tara:strand:+ start:779 stop:1549 length:771 start_codon:yes stop_codon:yes gene_type:complete
MPQGKGTYGSKKGRPPKRTMGPDTKPKSPRLTKEQFKKSVERFENVKDAVSKKNVHQDSRSKQATRYRRMFDNPHLGLKPKTKAHNIHKSTGGRVKKQLGGAMTGVGAAGVQRPLAAGAQPLAAGAARPLAAGAAGVQRPVGGGVRPGTRMANKGGRVKKASGGGILKRVLKKDIADSRKKLNPHQDPRSSMSSILRRHHDNPSKKTNKKHPNIHTDPKKRTIHDKYLKHLGDMPKGRRTKSYPRPLTKRSGKGKK